MSDDIKQPLDAATRDTIAIISARFRGQDFVTVSEVADLLGVSDDHVRKHYPVVHSGERVWRIPVVTLIERFIERSRRNERGAASTRLVSVAAIVPGILLMFASFFGLAPEAHGDDTGKQVLAFNPGLTACTDGSALAYEAEGSQIVARVSPGRVYPLLSTSQDQYGPLYKIKVGGKTCQVEGRQVAVLKGPLDVSGFNRQMLRPTEETYSGGTGTAALEGLLAAKPTVRSGPARSAQELGEVEPGAVVQAATWETEGEGNLTGATVWLPISWNGVVAWVQAESLMPVEQFTDADMTTAVPLSTSVSLHEAPSNGSPVVSTQEAGTSLSCATPWMGWLSCRTDSGTGWLYQADLGGAGSSSESAPPTPETGATSAPEYVVVGTDPESGDRIVECPDPPTKIRVLGDTKVRCATTQELLAKGQAAADVVKDKAAEVHEEAARPIDKGRLRFAALLGLAAIVVAALSVGMARVKQDHALLAKGASMLAPGAGLLPHLLLPGAVALALLAGKMAPTRNFGWYSIAGALVVAAVLGWTVGTKVLSFVKAPAFTQAALQYAGLTLLAVVPVAHWLGGASWPFSLVLAGPLAGLVAGLAPSLLSTSERGSEVVQGTPEASSAAVPSTDGDPFFNATTREHTGTMVANAARDMEARRDVSTAVPTGEPLVMEVVESPPVEQVGKSDDFWAGA